ncbi:hypothetical protein BT96DRAFT_938476 [Gymnopus androsaceus JB14]|uniref:Uncharacterized protein n=1 Tax=Gymnopus androsaceus JB14 TaxID=1447944 RepID=A0A6A4HVI6_9AGAR|nr:hypothetical protein BT96DRAFT_938476 [Gymnopus androsaceus JB14]
MATLVQLSAFFDINGYDTFGKSEFLDCMLHPDTVEEVKDDIPSEQAAKEFVAGLEEMFSLDDVLGSGCSFMSMSAEVITILEIFCKLNLCKEQGFFCELKDFIIRSHKKGAGYISKTWIMVLAGYGLAFTYHLIAHNTFLPQHSLKLQWAQDF